MTPRNAATTWNRTHNFPQLPKFAAKASTTIRVNVLVSGKLNSLPHSNYSLWALFGDTLVCMTVLYFLPLTVILSHRVELWHKDPSSSFRFSLIMKAQLISTSSRTLTIVRHDGFLYLTDFDLKIIYIPGCLLKADLSTSRIAGVSGNTAQRRWIPCKSRWSWCECGHKLLSRLLQSQHIVNSISKISSSKCM